MEKDLVYAEFVEIYGKLLTDNQYNVLKMYYFEDLSLGEIGEINGISRQGVLNTIEKARLILDDYESKLHLYDKRKKLIAISEEVSDVTIKSKLIELLEV